MARTPFRLLAAPNRNPARDRNPPDDRPNDNQPPGPGADGPQPDAPPPHLGIRVQPPTANSNESQNAAPTGGNPAQDGKKRDPLSAAMPSRIEDAIAAHKYVPYSALTIAARAKAASTDEAFTIDTDGCLKARAPDRKNERSISFLEWENVARAVVVTTRKYFGDDRADRLQQHHAWVARIAASLSWEVALEYDIREREAAAEDPTHDLSVYNDLLVSTIVNQISLRSLSAAAAATTAASSVAPQAANPLKRPRLQVDSVAQPPRKKIAGSHRCFRCGCTGHLPGNCTSTTTAAGRPCASLAPAARSPNALLATDGRQYCFSFARASACSYGASCTHHHGCSVCAALDHGAGSCKHGQ
ncbi:hypothetical protein EVJ58_g4672 [Rhodofomes roseus]|uniref:CCHC-type domain-containing protein n=1 Tax=Rhodofomes roseus TaxID=34475 RepID=A0A4Y9YI98_9APHY|nr:hypothetical protein EVJ58_g4672 [Rhodofomes roseus]